MEGTRGRKSLMESRSRVVTGNSNIFCVAKLDWQFIGNIRLRGVTPSFRVPCNQQKSPPLSISISLSPILAALHTLLDASLLDRWNVWYPNRRGRVTIPFQWLLSMRPPPNDTVPWTDATAASRPHLHHLRSFRRCLEWPPWRYLNFIRWIRSCFPFHSMIFSKVHPRGNLHFERFSFFSFLLFFEDLRRECNCFVHWEDDG